MAAGSLYTAFIDLAVRGKTKVATELAATEKAAAGAESSVGRSTGRMSTALKAVGVAAVGATAAVGAIGGAAVVMAARYEKSLANAVSVTGKTGKAAEQARAQMDSLAKKMGRETAFSAKEAADALYSLASSGWDTADMGKGLRGILDLAAATQSDLSSTTETVTAVLGQFGLQAGESGRVADVFTKAIGSSKANMDRLTQSFKMVGPVANALGYSVEDTTAILSKLYDAGFEGEQAGTALRGALSSLMNPVGQTKEGLKALGVSMDEVNPKTHSFTEILKTLKDAGIDASSATQLFGREAAPAMLALSNTGAPAIDRLTKSLKDADGAAGQVAKGQLDNLAGQFQILKGSVETAAITFGQRLTPGLTSVVKAVIPLVNSFATNGIPRLFSLAASAGKFLSDAFNGLKDRAIALFTPLGKYLAPALHNMQAGFVALKPAIGPVGALLGGVLKGALMAILPIIGTVLVVALNAAALAFRGIATVIGWVGQKLQPFIPQIRLAGQIIGFVLGTLIGSSVGLAIKALTRLFPFLARLAPFFSRILTSGRSAFTALGKVFQTLLARATQIFNSTRAVITRSFEVISTVTRAVWSGISRFLLGIWNRLVSLVMTSTGRIGASVSRSWQRVLSITRSVFSAVQAFLLRVWRAVESFIIKTALKIYNSILGRWQQIRSVTESAFSAVQRFITDKLTTAFNNAKNIASKLWSTLQSTWQAIKNGTATAWTAISGLMWQPVRTAYDKIKDFIDRIKEIVGGVLVAFGQDNPFKSSSGGPGSPPKNSGQARQTNFARGGIPMPDGGTPALQRRKNPQYHVWAEEDGESYIPHARKHRHRAESILATTAKMFGGAYMPPAQARRWPKSMLTHTGEVHQHATGAVLGVPGGQVYASFMEYIPGYRFTADSRHHGVDVGQSTGTPVYAPAAGRIDFTDGPGVGGYNNAIGTTYLTKDGKEVSLVSGHLGTGTLNSGTRVDAKSMLGRIGTSYDAAGTSPHVHHQASTQAPAHYGDAGIYDPFDLWKQVGGQTAYPSGGTRAGGPSLADRIWTGEGGGPAKSWKGALGGSVLNSAANILPGGGLLKAALDVYPGLKKLLPDKLPSLGGGIIADTLVKFFENYKSWVKDWIYGKFGSKLGSSDGSSPLKGGGDPAGNRALGQKAAQQTRGWTGANWEGMDYIAQHESGWDNLAQNPSSTAFGIPQFLDSTWAETGIAKTSDPGKQIEAFMRYMESRYGDAASAASFWKSNGWYDKGGLIKREHQAVVHPNELYLPLDRPSVMQTAQTALGTAELRDELSGLRADLRDAGIRIRQIDGQAQDVIERGQHNGAARYVKSSHGSREVHNSVKKVDLVRSFGGGG